MKKTNDIENNGHGVWSSWNNRISHEYIRFEKPESLAALQSLVAESRNIRCVGTGKSSSDICAGADVLVSMEKLAGLLHMGTCTMDEGTQLYFVQAEAGIPLGELVKALESRGYCIPALPDIDNITLGGALATGTHGTGHAALSLSDYLVGCTLVDAAGTVVHSGFFPPDSPLAGQDDYCPFGPGPDIDAVKVSLGLLGILYAPVLRVEPLFNLALQEEAVPNELWQAHWQQWQADQDFTRVLFVPHTGFGWAISGMRFEGVPPFEAMPAPRHHKNRRKTSSRLYNRFGFVPPLTVLANRFLRVRYFSGMIRKLGTLYGTTVTTSRSGSGTMVLAEWAIPFERFDACFTELKAVLENPRDPAGVHIPMDVRFYGKSPAWLSNACEGDTVSIGCVCRVPERADEYRGFDRMEAVMLKYRARPHWAKHFKAGPETLRTLYPRYDEFVQLRRTWDPEGKFLNSWLSAYFA